MKTSQTESPFRPPKWGLGWLDSRGRFASKTAILFERGALLVDVEVCLPDLESEDLSNRIAVLELGSEDLSNRIAVLASQGGSGVAGLAGSVRTSSGGSVQKGDTKGGRRSVPPKSL